MVKGVLVSEWGKVGSEVSGGRETRGRDSGQDKKALHVRGRLLKCDWGGLKQHFSKGIFFFDFQRL